MEQRISTTRVVEDLKHPRLLRRKVRLEVIKGPDQGKDETHARDEINIGSLPSNDLILTDSAVSRVHLRIAAGATGFVLTDLESTNGTFIHGIRIREVTVAHAVDVQLGDSLVRFTPLEGEIEVPLHPSDRCGSLIGQSPQMRALFVQLLAIAATDSTVLIEGETGTGKELLAEEIHKSSPRKDHSFIIVDCGTIPENLVESELFGHMRGAYTGATADRAGVFELARGGSIFLDEISGLSPASQPKLLRALESREIKPVGSSRYRPINVRIIAAANRDLRLAVNEGTFRPDLFYRLSVVRFHLPPLRDRPEDIEPLARLFMNNCWQRLAPGTAPPPLSRETVQRLVSHRWPGNIRELRNFIERVAIMAHSGQAAAPDLDPLSQEESRSEESICDAALYVDQPYKDAKMKWIDRFEVAYVTEILHRNKGNVAAAARQASVDRTYLFRLMRKYGIQR